MRSRDRTRIRVLRLCSVFEPPPSALVGKGVRFDPIGGMQNHPAELTRALDRRGIVQTVLTTRPPTAPYYQRLGDHARVIRVGFPLRRFRQLYAPQATIVAPILALRADLVHVHLGEDLPILPLGAAAARLHHLPLVLTVHTSLRYTLAVSDLRSAILKALGGPIERWGEHSAEAVVAITPRLRRLLLSDDVEENRVHLILPGVNPSLFEGPFEDPLVGLVVPLIAVASPDPGYLPVRMVAVHVLALSKPGVVSLPPGQHRLSLVGLHLKVESVHGLLAQGVEPHGLATVIDDQRGILAGATRSWLLLRGDEDVAWGRSSRLRLHLDGGRAKLWTRTEGPRLLSPRARGYRPGAPSPLAAQGGAQRDPCSAGACYLQELLTRHLSAQTCTFPCPYGRDGTLASTGKVTTVT